MSKELIQYHISKLCAKSEIDHNCDNHTDKIAHLECSFIKLCAIFVMN